MRRLLKSNPNIKLSIAGGGDDEKEIKDLVNRLNLSNQVEFHGRIPAEELNVLLAKSFASILFSNYENLPCVIVEAFASGVPFISTNVGGISEIINKERGILIKPQDIDGLVKAMNNVLEKDWNSTELRNYALDNFSYEKIGQEFDLVYKEVLGKQ